MVVLADTSSSIRNDGDMEQVSTPNAKVNAVEKEEKVAINEDSSDQLSIDVVTSDYDHFRRNNRNLLYNFIFINLRCSCRN